MMPIRFPVLILFSRGGSDKTTAIGDSVSDSEVEVGEASEGVMGGEGEGAEGAKDGGGADDEAIGELADAGCNDDTVLEIEVDAPVRVVETGGTQVQFAAWQPITIVDVE